MKPLTQAIVVFLAVFGIGNALAAQTRPADAPDITRDSAEANSWDVLSRLKMVSLSKTEALTNWRGMRCRVQEIASVDGRCASIPKTGAHILVLPIDDKVSTQGGYIDEWQAEWIRAKIDEATQSATPPDLIVLEIDTVGGRVDSSIDIGNAVNETRVPTVALVRRLAFSGGSIVAASCMRVYMRDGSTIGGAQAVSASGSTPEGDYKEKINSYLRSEFRSNAKRHGHPAAVCQAMTDRDLSVKEIYLLDKDAIISRHFESPDEIGSASCRERV